MSRLTGVFAPAPTPFDPITGDIDLIVLRRDLRRLVEAELSGVVLFGSTGEGPLLDEEERLSAIRAARDVLGEKVLLVGVAAESTRQAIRRAKAAAAEGADAVMLAPPSYYRPQLTPEAVREHYRAVADACTVPLLIYQVPPVYAGVELKPGLVAELSRHANIAGIKDSTGDLQAMGQTVAMVDRDFSVIVGNGAVLYAALEVGASAGILAVAVIAPEDCARLYALKMEGRDAEAGAIQERLAALHRAVVGGFGIPGVKAALDLLGISVGAPRPPLRPLRQKEVEKVRVALIAAGLLEREPAAATRTG